jgi:hypothetical protein
MDKTKSNSGDATDRLDALVRCCGGCVSFLHEDINGFGICEQTGWCTACDVEACNLFEPNSLLDRNEG